MSDKILLRRGNKADLPALNAGEPGISLDTSELFIGHSTGNKKIGVENPWGDNTSLLRPASKSKFGGTATINASTWTKVPFGQVVYDNLSNYNVATYRFTALQKGIYLITAVTVALLAPSGCTLELSMYKNGLSDRRLDYQMGTGTAMGLVGSAAVSLNVNDYVEIYFQTTAALNLSGGDSFFEVTRIA